MRFSTAKEHRDFFQKQGRIEFEGLLSSEQLILANQAIDQVIAKRSPELLTAEKMYLQGHDLWRSNPFLHRLVTQVHFPSIASELIERKPLRLGYDQLFPHAGQFIQEGEQIYSRFLDKTASLQAVSCLTEVVCGLMFAITGQAPFELETADIFPSRAGNAIFFRSDLPIRWDRLYVHCEQRFYLIVYTSATTHYQLQPQDPHTHSLKRLGYILNDKLNDKLNPIIYR